MLRHLLFWPAFCLLYGYVQGVLMPAIRRTPAGEEADKQSTALHVVGALVYFLPLVLAPTWVDVGASVAARLILFDLGLNYGAGDPLLAVGHKALFDRTLRKLAPDNPETLNGLVKLTALLCCVAVGVYYCLTK